MKELGFRVLDKDTNIIYGQNEFILSFDKIGDDVYLCNEYGSKPLYNYEIMQYTGLKDKYNEKIYDGDIIEYYDNGWNDCFVAKQVKFENGIFWADDIILTKVNHISKIIGNMYENPELLY